MQISAREACVRPHFHTRSEIKEIIKKCISSSTPSKNKNANIPEVNLSIHNSRRYSSNSQICSLP